MKMGHNAVIDHIELCETSQNEKDKKKLLTVVRKYRSEYETKINEALLIKKLSPLLNKQLYVKGSKLLLQVHE